MHYGMIEKVEMFRTRDNKDFESESEAISHAVDLAGAEIQNRLMSLGCDMDAVRKVLRGLLVRPDNGLAMENLCKLRDTIVNVVGP